MGYWWTIALACITVPLAREIVQCGGRAGDELCCQQLLPPPPAVTTPVLVSTSGPSTASLLP